MQQASATCYKCTHFLSLSSHITNSKSNRGNVYRVGLDCTGKVSSTHCSNSLGHNYDEASGVTFVNAHHYQHTKIGYNSCHTVGVEAPIRLGCSLSVGVIVGMKKSGRLFRHNRRIAEAIEPGLLVKASTDYIGAWTVLHPSSVYCHDGMIMCPCRVYDDISGYWSHVQVSEPLYIIWLS